MSTAGLPIDINTPVEQYPRIKGVPNEWNEPLNDAAVNALQNIILDDVNIARRCAQIVLHGVLYCSPIRVHPKWCNIELVTTLMESRPALRDAAQRGYTTQNYAGIRDLGEPLKIITATRL